MTQPRKQAYCFLLYWGMLEIRGIEWSFKAYPKWKIIDPRFWFREFRRIRYCGAVGEAMHNLALFASHDFDRFEEDWFWGEIASLNKKFPDIAFNYRNLFESRLKEFEDGTAPDHAYTAETVELISEGKRNTL